MKFFGLPDLLFPRFCPVCGTELADDEHPLCVVCNMRIPRLNIFHKPYDNYLAQMFYGFWDTGSTEKAAAFMNFQPHSDMAKLVYDMKYHGMANVAKEIGNIIGQEADKEGFFDGIDILLPMPITIERQLHRGYNQCERLARGISEVTGIPVETKAVMRITFMKSQTRLTRHERESNVTGVFQVVVPERLENKHILIVEDIITTTSTVRNMIEEIKTYCPNTKVSVLALGLTGGVKPIRQTPPKT